MAAPPSDANSEAAQIADNGHAIRTVGEMTTIILVVEPGAYPGFSDDSGNPLLENLICHDRNPFMFMYDVWCMIGEEIHKSSRTIGLGPFLNSFNKRPAI